MVKDNERTPLLSTRTGATSYTTTNPRSEPGPDPNGSTLDRRQTWPATRNLLSRTTEGLKSAYQVVSSVIYTPAPTEEELDQIISEWSAIGESEVKAQLTNTALDHFGRSTFIHSRTMPKSKLPTRGEKPSHVKIHHLTRHIAKIGSQVESGPFIDPPSPTIRSAENTTVPNSSNVDLGTRFNNLNTGFQAYNLQSLSCHGHRSPLAAARPKWPELQGIIDESVRVCQAKYGGGDSITVSDIRDI